LADIRPCTSSPCAARAMPTVDRDALLASTGRR
jgi:hypothetical protein